MANLKEVFEFIHKELDKKEEDKTLSQFAKEVGTAEKNLTMFRKYDENSDAAFRIAWVILKGLLGRAPIDLPTDNRAEIYRKFSKVASGDHAGLLENFLDILLNEELLRRKMYYRLIGSQVELIHQELRLLKAS